MYEFDWANRSLWFLEDAVEPPHASQLPRAEVARTLLLHWQEHCIECAPPACYAVCPLYVSRRDRKCARFVYGIYPNPRFGGLLDRGADVRFRRWAKIEAEMTGVGVSVARHRALDRTDAVVSKVVSSAATALGRVDRRRRLNGALTLSRNWALPHLAGRHGGGYDAFVLECFVPEPEPFRLVLEQVVNDAVVFRHAFALEHGHNFHTLPAAAFELADASQSSRILVYPENDAERRVVFTWLDLVEYAASANGRKPSPEAAAPAATVKCVAWDLDNTLWEGTLIEDGPSGCRVRKEVVSIIEHLDERGILQTVVSKNDHDEAWQMIVDLGLADYFLYPSINWGTKSGGLQQIADALNINIDTFAFVDDSPFERAEVERALPMVRIYAEDEVGGLLDRPEFDVPVTEMSRRRRASYRDQIQRATAQESFRGNYLDFLRSCEMRMNVLVPREESAVRRCLELIQRSNQLNLSGRRYSAEELDALLATDGVLSLAIECADRFGEYGIVGFVSVDERPEIPLVRDFVLSCRVAQKRVEHTLFGALARREVDRGRERLRAELIRTSRNAPLARVFEDLPFRAVSSDGPVVYEMSLAHQPDPDGVIELRGELGRG
jgi:FkbH-like protein